MRIKIFIWRLPKEQAVFQTTTSQIQMVIKNIRSNWIRFISSLRHDLHLFFDGIGRPFFQHVSFFRCGSWYLQRRWWRAFNGSILPYARVYCVGGPRVCDCMQFYIFFRMTVLWDYAQSVFRFWIPIIEYFEAAVHFCFQTLQLHGERSQNTIVP